MICNGLAYELLVYRKICENSLKYDPFSVLRLCERLNRNGVETRKWIIIEETEHVKDFKAVYSGEPVVSAIEYVSIFGGVFKVTDQIRDKEYILDMNKGLWITDSDSMPINSYSVLSNNFLCDYTDFPHILFADKGLYEDSIKK